VISLVGELLFSFYFSVCTIGDFGNFSTPLATRCDWEGQISQFVARILGATASNLFADFFERVNEGEAGQDGPRFFCSFLMAEASCLTADSSNLILFCICTLFC
jgi:hypothetical protein